MPLTEVAVNDGCGWGGLQVYGICSRRLVYSETVEAQSNYNKPYLWCGDLEISIVMIRLRVNGLKKPELVYLLDLFGEREEEGWCDYVCVKRF